MLGAMRRIAILSLLVTTQLLAAEAGYRIVHPDGTVEYTDQAIKGSEEIQIREVSTFSSPSSDQSPGGTAPVTAQNGQAESSNKQNLDYQSIAIASPKEQETVWFDANGMVVSLQIEPGLADGDEVVLRLDGEVVASGRGTTFTLTNVYRGTHTMTAVVMDGHGDVLLESQPVTFYMRQHSVFESPSSPQSPTTPVP